MGSFSKVEKVSGKERGHYELWGSGDFAVSRMLQNWRFDSAMVMFLDCVRQLGEYVRKRDPSVKLPHS